MELLGIMTVQFSTAHRAVPGRNNAWELAVLLLGVALIGRGLVPMWRRRQWRADAYPATGRVVEYVPLPAAWGKMAWIPLIEFEADGVTVTFDSPGGAGRRRWPVGRMVDVLYDPADPHRAGLASSGAALSWSLIFGIAVVGIFFGLVSA